MLTGLIRGVVPSLPRDRALPGARHPDVNARERLSVPTVGDLADQSRRGLRCHWSRAQNEAEDKEGERENDLAYSR